LLPPLKWAGGKRWQVPYLRSLWKRESRKRLVEPFCGGLAVALGLRPNRALISDINPHLANFYRSIRDGLVIDLEMLNSSETYYAHRDRFNQLIELGQSQTAEAASLFYYLNKTGFNGLCRFNQKGLFNVPFGAFGKINYRRDFSEYSATFSRWEFSTADFAMLQVSKGDFIYADPPYDVDFTRYSKQVFGWNDQVRLAHWLASHSGPVVLSNLATDRIVGLYSKLGFHIAKLDDLAPVQWTV
jgi:DNA adenine methylase